MKGALSHAERNAPKRVLMSNLVDFARGEGDAGHQSALLANFTAMGHEVRMLTPGRAGAAAAVARFGARAVVTPSGTALGLPGSFDALWQLPKLLQARCAWRMNILYVRVTTLCFVQVLVARALGMRVVVEHNGWTASERRVRGGGALMCAFERWSQLAAARHAHRSRCVTSGLARLLTDGGVAPEKIFVVGNGVDLDKFRVLPTVRAPDGTLVEPQTIAVQMWAMDDGSWNYCNYGYGYTSGYGGTGYGGTGGYGTGGLAEPPLELALPIPL